MSETIDPKL